MSTFSDSSSTRPFDDDDGYLGYDPRLPSQRFDSFDAESVKESVVDDSPVFNNSPSSYAAAGADVFVSPETPPAPPIYSSSAGFGADPPVFTSLEPNGKPFDGGFGGSDGPILPPPSEMQEEGFALREWKRQNAILLQEKEKREKELLSQIIDEADEYKVEFYQKRKINVEANKSNNREKEKLFLANQEKFHAEANTSYWKAIAELIPNEVPAIEKKKGKKDQDKKPAIVVIQGPKPGKPADLHRMRQILLKLKHNTPAHLKLAPSPPAPEPAKDAKAPAVPPKAAPVAASLEPVTVA